jgi:hypothetical protein
VMKDKSNATKKKKGEKVSINDFGLGRGTTPVSGGGMLIKIVVGWFIKK